MTSSELGEGECNDGANIENVVNIYIQADNLLILLI